MTESDHCCMCINNLDLDHNATIANGIANLLGHADPPLLLCEIQESICKEAGCIK